MINIAFWRSCGNRDSTISTGANRYSSWRKWLLNWRKSLFKLVEIFGGTKLPIPLWPACKQEKILPLATSHIAHSRNRSNPVCTANCYATF